MSIVRAMRPKTKEEGRMPRDDLNFPQLLETFRRGALMAEADDALQKIVAAMAETGNNGKLVIEIPLKFNKAGQIEITPAIKATVPRRSMPSGIYYANEEGRLTVRDPKQADIEDYIARGDRGAN